MDQQMPFIGITNLAAMKNILTIYRTDFRFRLCSRREYCRSDVLRKATDYLEGDRARLIR